MCLSPQFPADLVTFTEEILNEKLHFLCSDIIIIIIVAQRRIQNFLKHLRCSFLQK